MGAETCMPSPALEARALTRSFGLRPALRGVDLKVAHGEFLAVFGANGAGKTTLIKVLATLLHPTSGEVLVDGMNPNRDAGEIRRRIGMVTHQSYLYGNLTGYENLEFYCRLYGISGRQERILEVADLLGVTSRLKERVGTLSRGLQQRLSLARALLHEPDIMLMDEPEAGLDQESISRLWVGLQGAKRRTIVLTTHNLERGLELSDRLVILNRGRIAYEGSSRTLDAAGLKELYRNGGGSVK